MNFETLHLCNANHQNTIKEYIQLITKNDAVVFYSKKMNKTQYDTINKLMGNNRVYFIIDKNNHNLNTISYDDWLNLVNLYKKSFTWK